MFQSGISASRNNDEVDPDLPRKAADFFKCPSFAKMKVLGAQRYFVQFSRFA
jgi:hypothetical protein